MMVEQQQQQQQMEEELGRGLKRQGSPGSDPRPLKERHLLPLQLPDNKWQRSGWFSSSRGDSSSSRGSYTRGPQVGQGFCNAPAIWPGCLINICQA
jgi:hypothetical protein